MDDELLTTAEAASILRVSRTAMWAWRRTGHLPEPINIAPPEHRRPTLRWRRSEVLALIGGEQS
jgi:predicted DNA-binding transcriptional regulator AlpA